MTLNNDTRLSPGFVDGILDPRIPEDAGIVVPVYDDTSGHMRIVADYRGPACDYEPKPILRKLPISDACAFMITKSAWLAVGGFDERSFGKFAWGSDADLCLRAREAGFGVYATEMAYINHFGRKTANVVNQSLRGAGAVSLPLRTDALLGQGLAPADDAADRDRAAVGVVRSRLARWPGIRASRVAHARHD